MCGIVGKFIFKEQKTVLQKEIQAMTDAIAHRGPNDQGWYVKNNIGLGNRRLSIIDLSPAGHQPMSNHSKTIWITFNGEIYNFKELREQLVKKGYQFASHTDTECIIYLYQEYGIKCLNYLRGMFAFAIWDETKKQLFLARDRLGKKPLKYYIDKEKIVFASELKAILKDPTIPKEPDFEAIHHYLSLQYTPTPHTGFKGIYKLPPGHYATISSQGIIHIQQYWQLDHSKKTYKSKSQWSKEIIEQLKESVRLRMIADVPIGAFLSGGIDSSLIVALMRMITSKPIQTFTISFAENNYDESSFARIVAEKFNTHHTEFKVTPDVINILPDIVRAYEEPFADSSAIPSWYLSQMTRQHVTVALNGDGGDENFAGYQRYNILKFLSMAHIFPLSLRKKIIAPLAQFLLGLWNNPRQEKAKVLFESIQHSLGKTYFYLISYFNDEQKQKLYKQNFIKHLNSPHTSSIIEEKLSIVRSKNDLIDSLLALDIKTYLPDDLLTKIDIASMAHSLEVRSPFLDHIFMEFTSTIPSSLKLMGQTNKYILKKAIKDVLPTPIINRRKMGFQAPISVWFKKDLNGYLRQHLLSKNTAILEWFNAKEIENLIYSHQKNKTSYAHQLWALLTLEHWHKVFFN